MSDKGAEYWINAIDRDILEPDKIHVYIDHLRSEVTALRDALTAAGAVIKRATNNKKMFASILKDSPEYTAHVAAMKKVEELK